MSSLEHSVDTSLKDGHLNSFRLLLVIDQLCIPFAQWLFYSDVRDKDENESFYEYLVPQDSKQAIKGGNSKKHSMTKRDFRNENFYPTDKRKITEDKKGDSFDISLWIKVLKLALQKDPSDVIEKLRKILNTRNSIEHGHLFVEHENFEESIKLLEKKLVELVESAKGCYGEYSTAESIRQKIKGIKEQDLKEEDIKCYKKNFELNFNRKVILEKGTKQLKPMLKEESKVGGLTDALKPKDLIDINTIFTELDMEVWEDGDTEREQISHVNIINKLQEFQEKDDNGHTQILFVKGVAGCGKSTFVKLLLSDWSNGTGSVKGLDDYKVLIFINCSKIHKEISSLRDLICRQMDEAYADLRGDNKEESIFSLKTLVIFDGLEELDFSLENIFQEALGIMSWSDTTIICTIRTERCDEFSRRVQDDVRKIFMEVKGVSVASRKILIQKLHEELQRQGTGTSKLESLLKYLEEKNVQPSEKKEVLLSDYWSLPVNLAKLTYLWTVDSESVGTITTATELSYKFHILTEKRISDRLKQVSKSDEDDIDKSIDFFVTALCFEALIGIKDNRLALNEESLERLSNVCDSLSLCLEEMLGEFLCSGNVKEFCFYHKSLQEFYASLYIYRTVTNREKSGNIEGEISNNTKKMISQFREMFTSKNIPDDVAKDITNEISKALRNYHNTNIKEILKCLESKDFYRYQNTFINLIGLFYLDKLVHDSHNLQEVLNLLSEAGIKGRDSWIMVLNTVNCEAKMLKKITEREDFNFGSDKISVNNLFAYSLLVEHIESKKVTVDINVDPQDVTPPLDKVLKKLLERNIKVDTLILTYLFQHPEVKRCGDFNSQIIEFVNKLVQKNYCGPLYKKMKLLPTMEKLRASISSPEELEILKKFLRTKKDLSLLHICIDINIDPASLSSIPLDSQEKCNPRLYFPGVSHQTIEKVSKLIDVLVPDNVRILEIFFPRCILKCHKELEDTMAVLNPCPSTPSSRRTSLVGDAKEYYFPSSCQNLFQELIWEKAFCGRKGIDFWK